jgi:hypothetical protein
MIQGGLQIFQRSRKANKTIGYLRRETRKGLLVSESMKRQICSKLPDSSMIILRVDTKIFPENKKIGEDYPASGQPRHSRVGLFCLNKKQLS